MDKKYYLKWAEIFEKINILDKPCKESEVLDFFKSGKICKSLSQSQVQLLTNISELTYLLSELKSENKDDILTIKFLKRLHYLIFKDGGLSDEKVSLGIVPGEYYNVVPAHFDLLSIYEQKRVQDRRDLFPEDCNEKLETMLEKLRSQDESDEALVLNTILSGMLSANAFYAYDDLAIIYANIVLSIFGHELIVIDTDYKVYKNQWYKDINHCKDLVAYCRKPKGVIGLVKSKFF